MGDSFLKVTTTPAIYWQIPERQASSLKEEIIPSWTMENFEGEGAQGVEGCTNMILIGIKRLKTSILKKNI